LDHSSVQFGFSKLGRPKDIVQIFYFYPNDQLTGAKQYQIEQLKKTKNISGNYRKQADSASYKRR